MEPSIPAHTHDIAESRSACDQLRWNRGSSLQLEREAPMTETAMKAGTYDRSCKAISFLALFILSALSHVWCVLAAMCAGAILWHAIVLARRALLPVIARTLSTFGRLSIGWAGAHRRTTLINSIRHLRCLNHLNTPGRGLFDPWTTAKMDASRNHPEN